MDQVVFVRISIFTLCSTFIVQKTSIYLDGKSTVGVCSHVQVCLIIKFYARIYEYNFHCLSAIKNIYIMAFNLSEDVINILGCFVAVSNVWTSMNGVFTNLYEFSWFITSFQKLKKVLLRV